MANLELDRHGLVVDDAVLRRDDDAIPVAAAAIVPIRRHLEQHVLRAADHELDGQPDGPVADFGLAGEHVAPGVGLEHAHDTARQRLAEALRLRVLEAHVRFGITTSLGGRLA